MISIEHKLANTELELCNIEQYLITLNLFYSNYLNFSVRITEQSVTVGSVKSEV